MKKVLHFLVSGIATLFFNCLSFGQAPPIQWQATLGGNSLDEMHAIKKTSDGGYIATGSSYSATDNVPRNQGESDVWIVKLTNTGTVQWSKTYGGSFWDNGWDVIQTSDGGYIVAATTESLDGDVWSLHGFADVWVLKLNSVGDTLWTRTYGGTDTEEMPHILQTTGGYVVAATTSSNDDDVSANHGAADMWVFKTDNNGAIQWQTCLGGTANETFFDLAPTSDGGFVLAGSTLSNNGNVIGNHGGLDYWVVKVNSAGSFVWQKAMGGVSDDIANSIQQTSDGGFIVGGFAISLGGDVAGSGSHGGGDSWIVKLDNSGSAIVWKKCFGGTSAEDYTYVRQTSDGGYLMVTSTNSTDGDVTGNHGSDDCWMVKMSSSGVLEWQKTLGGTSGERAWGIVATADGGGIVAGNTDSNDGNVSGNHGFRDAWLVKSGNGTLPVNLLYFKGKLENGIVKLAWSTASETNNDKFIVQRSRDGIHFINIGEVKSQGDGAVTRSYSFDDATIDVQSGQVFYYRLQQVDIDGKTTISPVVRIQTGKQEKFAWLLQNPTRDELVLQYESKQNETIAVRLVDLQGNVVLKQAWTVQTGVNTFRKPVARLTGGTYIVEVTGSRGSFTARVIKQ